MYPTQKYRSFVDRLPTGVPTLSTNLGPVLHGTRLVDTAYINFDVGQMTSNPASSDLRLLAGMVFRSCPWR
jgi:hypothetical protein